MIKSFGWKRVGILQGPSSIIDLLTDGIRFGLEHWHINISLDRRIQNETVELDAALTEMKKFARSKYSNLDVWVGEGPEKCGI